MDLVFTLFFNNMIIIFGLIMLFHTAFSAAEHLRITNQELTGLPLDYVVQAVLSLFAIMWGVLNGNHREIQAAAEVNQTKYDTQCNLLSYIFNQRGKAISAEHLPASTIAELDKVVFMGAQEDKIQTLEEKINVLVQEVEHWKATAAQRENEKLKLMQKCNELRQKVIRLKSDGAAYACKLETAFHSACQQVLSHLVQASSAITRTMRDREGIIM